MLLDPILKALVLDVRRACIAFDRVGAMRQPSRSRRLCALARVNARAACCV
jgi:hypothetical protein